MASKYDDKPPILAEDCFIHRGRDFGDGVSCGCSPLYVWWRYERLPEGCGIGLTCDLVGHCPKCRPMGHNLDTCDKCVKLFEMWGTVVDKANDSDTE